MAGFGAPSLGRARQEGPNPAGSANIRYQSAEGATAYGALGQARPNGEGDRDSTAKCKPSGPRRKLTSRVAREVHGAGGTGARQESNHICRSSIRDMNVPSSRWM